MSKVTEFFKKPFFRRYANYLVIAFVVLLFAVFSLSGSKELAKPSTLYLLEKIGIACPKCGKDVIIKKTKKGRKYFGCEANPDCDFMSWQKPSSETCPNCGGYMVEKGNKIACADEQCGYVKSK